MPDVLLSPPDSMHYVITLVSAMCTLFKLKEITGKGKASFEPDLMQPLNRSQIRLTIRNSLHYSVVVGVSVGFLGNWGEGGLVRVVCVRTSYVTGNLEKSSSYFYFTLKLFQ